MSEQQGNAGKILSFSQGPAFYFEKYKKLLNRGAYPEALSALRTACQKAPENLEYTMELAQLYTELDMFVESNHLLLKVYPEALLYRDECMYGMGCNFYGMQDVEKAQDCFEKVLEYYPDSTYAPDAADWLDFFDEEEEARAESMETEEEHRARMMLNGGQFTEARDVLQDLCRTYPERLHLRNNLALCYFCMGDIEQAVQHCLIALKQNTHHTGTLCNLILFYQTMGNQAAAKDYSRLLEHAERRDADDDLKAALTWCRLEQEEKAYPLLAAVREQLPYDYQVLHFSAACAQNLGKTAEAQEFLQDILRLWPGDLTAEFYLKQLRGTEKTEYQMPYTAQLPEEEAARLRISLAHSAAQEDEGLKAEWQQDDGLYRMVQWAQRSGGVSAQAILALLARIGDDRAQEILRKWLLYREEHDSVKQGILTVLHFLKAPQPYIAYMDGKISEVWLGSAPAGLEVPEEYDRVLAELRLLLGELEYLKLLPHAVGRFADYLQCFDAPPSLAGTPITVWAAALAAQSLADYGVSMTVAEVAEKALCRESSVRQCMQHMADMVASMELDLQENEEETNATE